MRRTARLPGSRNGTVALEFALLATLFLAMLLFVLFMGFRLYAQIALNYAAARAARMLAVDSRQTLSGSVSQFQTVTFCPLLDAFLACSNVGISLQPVVDYLNSSTAPPVPGSPTNTFSPGQDASLMLLQVSYTLPVFGWRMPGGGAAGSPTAGATLNVSYPYQNEY